MAWQWGGFSMIGQRARHNQAMIHAIIPDLLARPRATRPDATVAPGRTRAPIFLGVHAVAWHKAA